MTTDLALALAVALATASGVPLGMWACRIDPGPLAGRRARRRADRALARLARAGCANPAQCPTCTAYADRAEGNDQ